MNYAVGVFSLPFGRLRTGGRAVLYYFGGCSFALCKRKTATIRSSSTMLPQAKSCCDAGDRVNPAIEEAIAQSDKEQN
jgi:hypothetical protein